MKRKLPKSIQPEEFKLLIQQVSKKDKEARIAFLLAYGSGLRLSETTKLKKENFQSSFISIRESKHGVDRTVPIPKGWKKWMYDVLPIKKSNRSLQRNFKTAAKKAKLDPKYTFHSMRHGFATRCVESGMPINQVQLLLGHADISTTSIYTKARPMDALKSYENLF